MKSSENRAEDPGRPPTVTDSPWFWLPLFLTGALVALTLTAPKFSWRQPQIERQFQARERSGQSVSAHGGYSPLSTPDNPMLTLRPLLVFFTVVLLATTIWFWWIRIVRVWRASTTRDIKPPEQEGQST